MTKIQSAFGGSNVLDIEYLNLEFICYLGIVICLPAVFLAGCFIIWHLEFLYSKTQYSCSAFLGFRNSMRKRPIKLTAAHIKKANR